MDASNNEIMCDGEMHIDIMLGETKAKQRFIITPQLPFAAILGMDALKTLGAKIDCGLDLMTLPDGSSLQLSSPSPGEIASSASTSVSLASLAVIMDRLTITSPPHLSQSPITPSTTSPPTRH